MKIKKSFLNFEPMVTLPNRRTEIWGVFSQTNGADLGSIAWYNHWRKYCFYPAVNTVFDVACLTEITEFITAKMQERRES